MAVFKANRFCINGTLAGRLIGFRKPNSLSSKNVPGYLAETLPGVIRLDALVKTGDSIIREPGQLIKGKEPFFTPDSEVYATEAWLSHMILNNIVPPESEDPAVSRVSDEVVKYLEEETGLAEAKLAVMLLGRNTKKGDRS